MPDIVVKFGGSNLKSKKDVAKLANVIKSYNQPLVIVVSAFFGITDFLSEHVRKAGEGKIDVSCVIKKLEQRKQDAIAENIHDLKRRDVAFAEIQQSLHELKRYLLGINYIGETPDFLEDLILSYGERLSAVFLYHVLLAKGLDVELAFPEKIGLLTDGEYGNASVDYLASSENVKKALSHDRLYIIPGFYGVSPEGKTTLLGRGGTDYAAASIARCIGAKFLDIWKDVDGFLSGDPKLVDHPVRLDRIAYTEAAELAYFGAKILHPRTVEPLAEAHIPIRIFNINHDHPDFTPLSVINSEEVVREGVVKSVTYSDDVSILKLKGPGVGIKPGILAKVTTRLNEAGININSVITSQIAINLFVDSSDLKKAYAIVKDLELRAVSEIVAVDDVSLIAVVGLGMLENHGIAARLFSAVARKEINVEISCSGASQVVSYFVVARKDRTLAVKEIHKEFFENKQSINF